MKISIEGNNKLSGVVNIGGCKNSAVAIIPASILCDEEVILRNIPNIDDCHTLLDILTSLGHSVEIGEDAIIIRPVKKESITIYSKDVTKLRGSYYFLGAMLAKRKKVKTFYPGGCNLGVRPINYHLDGFKKMNVKVKTTDDKLILKTRDLIGNTIDLEFPSVGATINIMLAGVKAKGVTVINNAALEPEIIDVANFLISMGAIISGAGTKTIKITGVKRLHKTDYTVMPDRIEAGTYLILGAMSNGSGIKLKKANPEHLNSVIRLLKKSGCTIKVYNDNITIIKEKELLPINITVQTYPGFPTDLQQPLTALMTQINGTSSITETIFKNRFSQVEELRKMNANIEVINETVYVHGPSNLTNASVIGRDLRGAASLIMVGSILSGTTIVDNVEVFFRGYENPIEKFKNLGVNIKTIP